MAGSLDADGVELDLHASADGALVVFHDSELPGLGPIAGLPLHRIREFRLSNGEPVPTLAEVMGLIPSLDLWIEVKDLDRRWDATLLDLISRDPRPGRCAVHSFDHRLVARLGQQAPELRRGILSASYPLHPSAQLAGTGASALWQEWHLIDQALVDEIHAAGVAVIAWTVNHAGPAARLAALGVDGLCGNYPEHLRPS